MPFITFEGGEGAGKSTQIKLLADHLRDLGKDVVVTREPGGTEGGESIRRLLRGGIAWLPCSELLLQFAARYEHVEHVIRPAVGEGKFVLCDRFVDSTYAYQGYGMGMDLQTIAGLQTLTIGAFKPDCTFLLDIDPAAGLARAVNRDGTPERYEAMPFAFHEKIRAGYRTIAAQDPDRWSVIDALSSQTSIYRKIVDIVEARFTP